jgi:AcrR family transcriptional regulator
MEDLKERIGIMTRRDRAKASRRKAILDAARQVLREQGTAGFSIREVAKRANVSVVTPYNLIGTRYRITEALLLEDAELLQERLEAQSLADPLDGLFWIIEESAEWMEREPTYVRSLVEMRYNASFDRSPDSSPLPRHILIVTIVETLAEQGIIHPEIDRHMLVTLLDNCIQSSLFDWAAGLLSREQFIVQCEFNFAMAIHGAASAGIVGPLWRKILALQEARQI